MNKNCSLLLNFSGSYQLYPVLTSYGSQIAVSKQKVPSRTEVRLFPSLTEKVITGYFSAYKWASGKQKWTNKEVEKCSPIEDSEWQ